MASITLVELGEEIILNQASSWNIGFSSEVLIFCCARCLQVSHVGAGAIQTTCKFLDDSGRSWSALLEQAPDS